LTREANTLSWSPKGLAFVASFKEELKIRIYSNKSVLNLKTISSQLQKTGEKRDALSGSTRTESVLGPGLPSNIIASFLGDSSPGSSRGGKTNKRRKRRTKRRKNRRTKRRRIRGNR
jgi:hypothetical protein